MRRGKVWGQEEKYDESGEDKDESSSEDKRNKREEWLSRHMRTYR